MPAPDCAAMTASFHAPHFRQRGAAAIEFAVAGALVLLLGLLAIEAARWQGARQMAYLALMEAARAGATAHGDPARMRAAFLEALLPRHAGTQGQAGARRRQEDELAELRAISGTHPWRIEVLLPDEQSFREHARPDLKVAAAAGLRAIDNGYQDLQYARRPPRPGGQSIFQANTLKLRLTYLHKPLLPPLRALLAALGHDGASYAGNAQARGLLPLRMELEMEMHSHPVDWARRAPQPAGIVYGECRSLRCGRTKRGINRSRGRRSVAGVGLIGGLGSLSRRTGGRRAGARWRGRLGHGIGCQRGATRRSRRVLRQNVHEHLAFAHHAQFAAGAFLDGA